MSDTFIVKAEITYSNGNIFDFSGESQDSPLDLSKIPLFSPEEITQNAVAAHESEIESVNSEVSVVDAVTSATDDGGVQAPVAAVDPSVDDTVKG